MFEFEKIQIKKDFKGNDVLFCFSPWCACVEQAVQPVVVGVVLRLNEPVCWVGGSVSAVEAAVGAILVAQVHVVTNGEDGRRGSERDWRFGGKEIKCY